MAYKMKSKGELLGINEELSTFDKPVFEKDLEPGIIAEANMDRTTFVDKNASPIEKQEAVEHENGHHDQMQQNLLGYDNDNVYWKGKIIPRSSMQEGAHDLPWEDEVYNT